MIHEFGEIIAVLIHVVALPCLPRPSVAAAVVSNDAVTSLRQEQHLGIPRIGT
jgi:hypothetical protein